MGLREILSDIHALEEELLTFERKFGVRSETFCAAYMGGEKPEDAGGVLDFGESASVYRMWLARQADYRNEVQRQQGDAPSIAGLIRVATWAIRSGRWRIAIPSRTQGTQASKARIRTISTSRPISTITG